MQAIMFVRIPENALDSHTAMLQMSRKYNGNQAILREKCIVAHYVPCTAHSFNLVGKRAAGCPTAVRFFCLLQNLYTRLVASTHRWQVLQKHMKLIHANKALSDTRWSAWHYAVRSVNSSYHENIAALEELATNENQPRDCRLEEEGFLKEIEQLEVAILLEIWETILERKSLIEFVKK